jgi:hypothetical protein
VNAIGWPLVAGNQSSQHSGNPDRVQFKRLAIFGGWTSQVSGRNTGFAKRETFG